MCIIQPGVSRDMFRATNIAPVGITGDALPLKGQQTIQFCLGNKEFRQRFGVCILPTEADGLLA
jgi:hypothetical protein